MVNKVSFMDVMSPEGNNIIQQKKKKVIKINTDASKNAQNFTNFSLIQNEWKLFESCAAC